MENTYREAFKAFDHYIDEHLEDQDLIEKAIDASYISKFHFYRLFKAITNQTVQQYILEKRLTRVMLDLLGDDNILDIAIKNGFNSNEVLTRNFKKYLKMTPNAFKKLDEDQKKALYLDKTKVLHLNFDYLMLNINHVNGKTHSQDKSFTLASKRFIGLSRLSNDQMVSTIPDFVNRVARALEGLEGITEDALYRICHHVDASQDIPTFKEFVGVLVEDSKCPESLEELILDSCHVISFVHKGPLFKMDTEPVINTYELIYKYRLPAMNVYPTDQYYIERYGSDFYGPFDENSVTQIMMTVKSKV